MSRAPAGRIVMQPSTHALIRDGDANKGDVLGVARIAAIQAAKRTAELIPLCHPLPLTRVAVDFSLDEAASAVSIEVTTETLGRTGVEMEALTGATVGLLTVYDMCKAVDRGMRIEVGAPAREAGRQVGPLQGRAAGADATAIVRSTSRSCDERRGSGAVSSSTARRSLVHKEETMRRADARAGRFC